MLQINREIRATLRGHMLGIFGRKPKYPFETRTTHAVAATQLDRFLPGCLVVSACNTFDTCLTLTQWPFNRTVPLTTYNAEDFAERWKAREVWDGTVRPTRVEERFEEALLRVDWVV